MEKDPEYVPIDILLDAYCSNKPLPAGYTRSDAIMAYDEFFSFLDDPSAEDLDD